MQPRIAMNAAQPAYLKRPQFVCVFCDSVVVLSGINLQMSMLCPNGKCYSLREESRLSHNGLAVNTEPGSQQSLLPEDCVPLLICQSSLRYTLVSLVASTGTWAAWAHRNCVVLLENLASFGHMGFCGHAGNHIPNSE